MWMAPIVVCLQFTPQLSLSLHLPTKGWPGWVDLGGWLHNKMVHARRQTVIRLRWSRDQGLPLSRTFTAIINNTPKLTSISVCYVILNTERRTGRVQPCILAYISAFRILVMPCKVYCNSFPLAASGCRVLRCVRCDWSVHSTAGAASTARLIIHSSRWRCFIRNFAYQIKRSTVRSILVLIS